MIRTALVTTEEAAGETLPSLVDRAARSLAGARSAAEVLEAKDLASVAYDAAKRAARIMQARQAHDTLVAAAHRAQADALLIESQAKRRIADEYDAARERGEVQGHGGDRTSKISNENVAPALSEMSLSAKLLHEARKFRDAEARDPGIVERTVNAALERGEEPTRALVRREVSPILEAKARADADLYETKADERDFRRFRKFWRELRPGAQRLVREYLNAN